MGNVWSGHVQSVYNLVHVPDSDVQECMATHFQAVMVIVTKLQLREI